MEEMKVLAVRYAVGRGSGLEWCDWLGRSLLQRLCEILKEGSRHSTVAHSNGQHDVDVTVKSNSNLS